MANVAKRLDRFPPELFLRITILNGIAMIGVLFFICSVLSALLLRRAGLLVLATAIGLWLFWLFSSFDSRLIAMPVFFSIGSIELMLGSGVLIPSLRRR